MRIVGIELLRAALPLVTPFETSSHRKNLIEHILVRLIDASGREGWGEIACGPGPWFSAEDVETAWHIATTHLAPTVLGVEVERPQDVRVSWRRVRGNFTAKAGFDMAAWALHAACVEQTLAAALGGTRRSVAAGVSVGIEATVDDLIERVSGYLGEGYRRVKLKIRPGWDLTPVGAVRAAFPDALLHVDANGAYDPESPDHMRTLLALDALDLAAIEQPFPARSLLGHARLAQRAETLVCLDESVETTHDLADALALKAVGLLNIKTSRVGGLSAALDLAEQATDAGVGVWCGGMHEFGVGRAANLALSSREEFDYPGDVSASHKYYKRDITAPISAKCGTIEVSQSPGLGVDVDEPFLRSISSDGARFGIVPGTASL